MFETLKTLFNPKSPEERAGEITIGEYFSSLLSPIDGENVQYLRDSLHSALLERDVPSALIAVGSVVRGVSSKKSFYNSAGPNDIDLKLIIADPKKGKVFYNALEQWSETLGERFTGVDGPLKAIRFTHRIIPEEHINFKYDGGFRIEPREGKKLDLIVKGVGYLPAGPHIEAERDRNNAFVVLYHDK